MNFTYYKFLFVTTIKKRPIWITWLLYLLTCVSFLIILPAVARMNTLQVWANTTMAVCQTFLGMTVALFTSVLAIHIFKDGLEEGTELIVVSKPISKTKMTISKVLLFGTFCLMVNLTAVLITIFTIFLPTTEMKFYWGLIVSMFIGNLICFGIFGSIAILLTIKFAKVGVIITNILISLIFLIYQALSLFVFSIPSKSLPDHGVTAPSYIITDRNTTTGEYKEDEVVCFTTDIAKQITSLPESEWNRSVTWQDMKEYWTGEICKNNPAPMLNVTDLAGQISLTYLSVNIDKYAYRQGHRFFAISRFYTYDLVSPASPEIISGVENKKDLPWIYNNQSKLDITNDEGETIFTFYLPKSVGFAGIAPLGTTRLRGYTDLIPVGYYVKTGEALSSKDVMFEPEQWKKYAPAFNKICDELFEYKYYTDCINDPEIINDPSLWPSAWASNNQAIGKYYKLLWSCLMGQSADEAYFGNDFLKDYPKEYFDINNVNELNERFLQFKYFVYYRALAEQQKLLSSAPTTDEEKIAKQTTGENLMTKLYESVLNLKHFDNNWMVQDAGGEVDLPFIEPGTQTVDLQLIFDTCNTLNDMLSKKYSNNDITLKDKQEILTKSTKAQLLRTQAMYNHIANVHEEYLYDNIKTPERSATFHGKSYTVTTDWVPYWETLLTPVGHNMQWFFYSSRETVQFWIYTTIWATISLSLFAAGILAYKKFDVK